MSWQHWLSLGDVKPHRTGKQELDNMCALVGRDPADAALQALSDGRRFATAYNAALTTANMAVACSGHRVTARTGHHRVTFDAAALAIGAEALPFADSFDICRRKRSVIDSMTASIAFHE